MMPKRILITGASGFVGANLAHHFVSQGHTVATLLRPSSPRWRLDRILDQLRIIEGDLCQPDSLQGIREFRPHVIIHAATYGGFRYQDQDDLIISTNTLGLIHLLDCVKDIGFECFINTGSSSEYGPKSHPMSERDLCEPDSAYGISKLASTLYCRSIALKENLPIFTLRLFSPYGYFEDARRLFPTVISSFLSGEDLLINSLDPVRDFIFIDDVCLAYDAVINKAPHLEFGDIFNVGSGHQHCVGDVVDIVRQLTQNDITVAQTKGEPRIGDDALKWEADMAYTQLKLGFMPQLSLKEGISLLLNKYKEST